MPLLINLVVAMSLVAAPIGVAFASSQMDKGMDMHAGMGMEMDTGHDTQDDTQETYPQINPDAQSGVSVDYVSSMSMSDDGCGDNCDCCSTKSGCHCSGHSVPALPVLGLLAKLMSFDRGYTAAYEMEFQSFTTPLDSPPPIV